MKILRRGPEELSIDRLVLLGTQPRYSILETLDLNANRLKAALYLRPAEGV